MRYILLFILPVMLLSCNDQTAIERRIAAMEKELSKEFKVEVARDLVVIYDKYIHTYPTSPRIKGYLFSAATWSVNLKAGEKALVYLDRYLELYPNDPREPDCIFLKAFTYETVLDDKANAVLYYQELVLKFPEHELADAAEISLTLLQDPIELIRIFEAHNDSLLEDDP